jgi:aspartate carbamoyltransferase regulatory subunit
MTSYTSPRITAQTRKRAYALLGLLIDHIPHFQGIDIVSIVRNADNSVTITLTNPLPADQLEHLGLWGAG